MNWADANGAILRYEVSGAGSRTLVLLHEMGGTLESWDDVLPLLATGRRVLRYDLRGAGLSEKIRGELTMDILAEDLATLLDIAGVAGPVVLAGCAVGAGVALRFAMRFPERAAGLFVMAPATGLLPERRLRAIARADEIEQEGMRTVVDSGMGRNYPAELGVSAERLHAFRCRSIGNDPESYAAYYRMLAKLDMQADFSRIACPTYVLAGRLDQTRPPPVVEAVARAIPGARFEVIESGHVMMNLTPDLVSRKMTAFLGDLGW